MKGVEAMARKKKVDPETLKLQISRRYARKLNYDERPAMGDVIDQLYLNQWSNFWMKLKINFDHFGIDPENEADSSDRKQWTDSMNTYWTDIIKHAQSIAKEVPSDAEDDISMIKLYMPAKLVWLQKGLIFRNFDQAVRELPVANKFIFAQIQQLFDGGQTLCDAIIEVS